MTVIYMPPKMDLVNVNRWCIILDSIVPENICTFDYSTVDFFEPSGMLLCSAKIRQFMNKNPNAEYRDAYFTQHTYAANMGFFQCVNQDYGKQPGESPGNSNYLPISMLEVSKVRENAKDMSFHVVDYLETEAKRLSLVLSRSDEKLMKLLTYTLRELLRNVVEHSYAKHIWFAGQYWPTKNRVEIAILDEGIGIYKSLLKNTKLCVGDNDDALKASILPGVSSVRYPNPNDDYANSGYGLYITRRLALDAGDFVILSGNSMLGSNKLNPENMRSASLNGTMIRVRLNTDRIPFLENKLEQYIMEGEKLSKKVRQSTVVTASQISRLLIDD